MELVEAFFHILESLNPLIEDGDKMWCLGLKGEFDIKFFYGAWRGSSSITFPWKSIWPMKAPCRVTFFGWEYSHNQPFEENGLRYYGLVLPL